MAMVIGCGSSKSSSVNLESVYKGKTSQAEITSENAEDLSMGAYAGESIASTVQAMSKTGTHGTLESGKKRPVLQIVQQLKQSVRRMEIEKKAALIHVSARSANSTGVAGKTEKFNVYGDDGGTAAYNLDINYSTGSFKGTITYQAFSSLGIVFNGSATVNGNLSEDQQTIVRMSLSFSSLEMSSDNFILSLTGTLSWGFNLEYSTETLTMDMIVLDKEYSEYYWYNNYEIETFFSSGGISQNLSGRYYDHYNGYVDMSTSWQIVIENGSNWPSQGTLELAGSLGRWIHVNFMVDSYVIEADCDGDGNADFQTEISLTNEGSTNGAPIAEAGSDKNTPIYELVQLDGSGSSDPDGDPLTYSWSVISRPAGSYVSLTGSFTATPTFTPDKEGVYVFSLTVYDGHYSSNADTVNVTVIPPGSLYPDSVIEKWHSGIYGSNIGLAGLLAADLDHDGVREIITSASQGNFSNRTFWYVVRRNTDGGFEQIWRSPIYDATIIRICLADMNDDGNDDVVVALSNGFVFTYDGPTLKLTRTMNVAPPVSDMAIADLDGDGTTEIVVTDGFRIFVYNAGSGSLKWNSTTGGGLSLAIGNVDTDPSLEIVTTTYSGKGYVVNGLSGAIKWEYNNSFGAMVRLADLDGDTMKEIIGASPWNKITIFDADLKSPSWEIPADHDIAAVLVTDSDGDGVPDIIYGDGQWGKIHAIDVRTRLEKWSVENPEHGVSGIALGDVDQDGVSELIWGAGGSSSGPDFLFIANPLTASIKWKNMDISGLSPLSVDDIDGDGKQDIVMVSQSSNSGYDEGIVHIFSTETHILIYQESLGIMDWMGDSRTVKIGDVDGDGKKEFVVTTANVYDGIVRVYDGTTRAVKRDSAGYNGNFFSALAIGDVDNDGHVEIVAGQGREHTGATGVYLIVFDGATLQEKWRSVDLGDYWGAVYDIKLADLDKDGHPEIIASMKDDQLKVFDGVNHILKLSTDSPSRAIDIADVDGDGFSEIIAGRTDGKIDVYNGVTFDIKKTVSTYGITPVDALIVKNLDAQGAWEWIVSSGGFLSILQGPDEGSGLIWRSQNLGTNSGKNNHLSVMDVDGNGHPDIFIGSDTDIFQFEFIN
jgi:hypothetical protein